MGMESIYPKILLRRGIALGLKASIIATVMLWGVIILMGLLSKNGSNPNQQADPYIVTVILVFATMVVSLFPGAIGGATNAYLLYRLSIGGKLTEATSIVSGLLVGFLAGLATILGTYLISGAGVYARADFAQFALIVACVAAPVGGWHGWNIGRWLLEAP